VSDSAESVVRNFLAAWKRSDIDELVSFISEDAVYINGPRGVHHGIGAIKALIQSFVKVTPSTIVDVKTLVANGGREYPINGGSDLGIG
jgi:limonene-1,2-epoxide hydrolase